MTNSSEIKELIDIRINEAEKEYGAKDIAELAKKSVRITAENRNLVNWLNRIIYCFTFSARIPSNLIADLKKYLEEIGKLEV